MPQGGHNYGGVRRLTPPDALLVLMLQDYSSPCYDFSRQGHPLWVEVIARALHPDSYRDDKDDAPSAEGGDIEY